jgi:hypothetical protein
VIVYLCVCVSRNRICICIVCTGCCQERFSVLHQDPVWVGCLLMCQVMVGGIQGDVELHNMPIQVALSQEDAFRSPFSWVFITILSEKTLTLFQMFLFIIIHSALFHSHVNTSQRWLVMFFFNSLKLYFFTTNDVNLLFYVFFNNN